MIPSTHSQLPSPHLPDLEMLISDLTAKEEELADAASALEYSSPLTNIWQPLKQLAAIVESIPPRMLKRLEEMNWLDSFSQFLIMLTVARQIDQKKAQHLILSLRTLFVQRFGCLPDSDSRTPLQSREPLLQAVLGELRSVIGPLDPVLYGKVEERLAKHDPLSPSVFEGLFAVEEIIDLKQKLMAAKRLLADGQIGRVDFEKRIAEALHTTFDAKLDCRCIAKAYGDVFKRRLSTSFQIIVKVLLKYLSSPEQAIASSEKSERSEIAQPQLVEVAPQPVSADGIPRRKIA